MPKTHSTAGALVVGAGQAGLQVATSLRAMGVQGQLLLVGGEPLPPYRRPPLSKDMLTGKSPFDLSLRGESFYHEHGIDLVCGAWVDSVHLEDVASGRGTAITNEGRELPFQHLAITTGGYPRRLHVPGDDLSGVHYLRTLQNARALRQHLATAKRVVIVGGGFLGLEVAAGVTASGNQATVVEASDRLLSRAVAPVTSDFFAEAHRIRGAQLRFGVAVAKISGSDHVDSVHLSDGSVLQADCVVVSIGMIPDTRLGEQLGLHCEDGIVVDSSARTSIPAIVAAGDCTVVHDPEHGPRRLESVPNAIAQGKLAAASLLGAPPPRVDVPWFWSDQGGIRLQIAGLNTGYTDAVVRGSTASEQFSVLYFRGEELISIDAVNSTRDYLAARRIIETGGRLPLEAAADTATSLHEMAKAL